MNTDYVRLKIIKTYNKRVWNHHPINYIISYLMICVKNIKNRE